MNRKHERKKNKVFLIMIVLILFIGFSSTIRTQKGYLEIENRDLALFPHFNVSSFVTSDFQTNFDSAMSDQFILSETVKTNMKKH